MTASSERQVANKGNYIPDYRSRIWTMFSVCLFLSFMTTKRLSCSWVVEYVPVFHKALGSTPALLKKQNKEDKPFYHSYVFIKPFSCWCYIPSTESLRRHLKGQQGSSGVRENTAKPGNVSLIRGSPQCKQRANSQFVLWPLHGCPGMCHTHTDSPSTTRVPVKITR